MRQVCSLFQKGRGLEVKIESGLKGGLVWEVSSILHKVKLSYEVRVFK